MIPPFKFKPPRLSKGSLMCPDNLPTLVKLGDVPLKPDLKGDNCVVLVDMERPHLQDIGPEMFQLYQTILTTSKSVLWLQTNHADADAPPYWAMLEGLCRVCRSENPSTRIVTLTVEPATGLSPEATASRIAKLLRYSNHGLGEEQYEQEYLEVSGHLCINRLAQAKYLDEHISRRTQKAVRPRPFGRGPPIALDIQTPGLLDTLAWTEDRAAYDPLSPGQVEVGVRAIGVNFKECLTLLGRVNASTVGSECAGLVTRIGRDVERFRVGDRVIMASLETYKSLVRVRQSQVVKVPDAMSLANAAAIPTAFCTAYHCLCNVARLQKGERILIHAAAGGTGQAVVQIAQHIGAEIFVTVSSDVKRGLIMQQYQVPEDHIFYSRDASFAAGIKRMTGGRGVDVVINYLSGRLLVASWEIIAEFGRFIDIGRKDIDSRGYLPMFPFIKNASFSGVDLAAIVTGTERNLHSMQRVFDLM